MKNLEFEINQYFTKCIKHELPNFRYHTKSNFIPYYESTIFLLKFCCMINFSNKKNLFKINDFFALIHRFLHRITIPTKENHRQRSNEFQVDLFHIKPNRIIRLNINVYYLLVLLLFLIKSIIQKNIFCVRPDPTSLS